MYRIQYVVQCFSTGVPRCKSLPSNFSRCSAECQRKYAKTTIFSSFGLFFTLSCVNKFVFRISVPRAQKCSEPLMYYMSWIRTYFMDKLVSLKEQILLSSFSRIHKRLCFWILIESQDTQTLVSLKYIWRSLFITVRCISNFRVNFTKNFCSRQRWA